MILDKSIPVFANHRPWNELVLRGVRKFKTLSFPWKYRGPIYLYDAQKFDDFGLDWAADMGVKVPNPGSSLGRFKGFPGHIVGVVELYDIRSFENCEEMYDGHEILLRAPKRFPQPIPFKWPSGAIRIAHVK